MQSMGPVILEQLTLVKMSPLDARRSVTTLSFTEGPGLEAGSSLSFTVSFSKPHGFVTVKSVQLSFP